MNTFKRFCAAYVCRLILGFAFFLMTPSFAKAPLKILVVGDSLSAEYGLARSTGWVHLLSQKIAKSNLKAQIVNASISGDTSAGGLARLPTLLTRHKPDLVMIELGGNDGLRGLTISQLEKNLAQMLVKTKEAGAKPFLLGMQIPPNFGAAYAKDFSQMYIRLAQKYQTALVPFFLKDIADSPNSRNLFQADGIHPNEAAQHIMMMNVWGVLEPLLRLPTTLKKS